MSYQTGCRAGVAARGGKPRQCAKAKVAAILVQEVNGSRHTLDVCQDHYQSFADRLQGTEYVEVKGQPAPRQVRLVSL
jgi:hypothetical protein